MIKNMLLNWKTSSAGLTLIIGAGVHIYFLYRSPQPITETDVMLAVGGILGGFGMLAAGDASKSQKDVKEVDAKVQETAKAVITGDTATLVKNAVPTTPPTDK